MEYDPVSVQSGELMAQSAEELSTETGGEGITNRRLIIAMLCVLFPIVLFLLAVIVGHLIYGVDRMWDFSTKNFDVFYGVPMAIIASLTVVVILVTTTPKDKFSIKLLSSFEMTGPSVPIVLWIGCFLAIMLGIYMMSGKLKDSGASKSDAHSPPASELHSSPTSELR